MADEEHRPLEPENPIDHPGVKDKWEARLSSMSLKEQLEALSDIQRQLDDSKSKWSEIYEKTQMHKRDLDYVAQIIASKLPKSVIECVLSQKERKP